MAEGADGQEKSEEPSGRKLAKARDKGQVAKSQEVSSWFMLFSLLLILGLALTVNSIEFFCSAALPAVYTHVLTLSDLSTVAHYGYISLYVAFFMLDDLIIFGLAAFAIQKVIDTRYAAVSRLAGGIILIGLGGWMLMR